MVVPSGESLPHLRWSDTPAVSQPVLLVAFGGWNDAGDAASTAIDYLIDEWDTNEFADIDPEEFFDFTATRPEVRIDLGGTRQIEWPSNAFHAGRVPNTDIDVVLMSGIEPQLKWRTFCEHVIGVAKAVDARLIVTLGALLAEVPHSRPVSVFGTAYDEATVDA